MENPATTTPDEPSKPLSFLDLMKPEEITVEKLWKVFAAGYFGPGARVSQIQHDEMKKAFMIGFGECFKLAGDISEGLPEDEASKHLTRLNNEVAVYMDKMREESLARLKREASGLVLPPHMRGGS